MNLARVRALIVMGALLAVTASIVAWAILRDDNTVDEATERCPAGAVPAETALPEPADVAVNVYNSTDQSGLAQEVAGQLEEYGFEIGEVGNDPVTRRSVEVPAELRFGPDGVGAAHLLSAYVLDSDRVPDVEREGSDVDFVLGQQFQQLNTQSEVNQAVSQLADPQIPDGMC